jgi:ring-1,2-phenylacetyl-CoA epoxidase subunit PaaC
MSALYNYVIHLADNNLILGQRLSEWCGHGPFLEEDLALTNSCLDILGQSQMLLNYAAELQGEGKTADDLAFLRDAHEFRNVLLVEQPNGDFAQTMVRQYFVDVYNVQLYTALSESKDETLAAIAAKSLKESEYHLERSAEWMNRMAFGTEESESRLQNAFDELWGYHLELFEDTEGQQDLVSQGIAVDNNNLKDKWTTVVNSWLKTSPINAPESYWHATGGLQGHHSEYLGHMLCEMQFLQRAYPNCEW